MVQDVSRSSADSNPDTDEPPLRAARRQNDGHDIARVLLTAYAERAGVDPAGPLMPDVDAVIDRATDGGTRAPVDVDVLLSAFNDAVERAYRRELTSRQRDLARRHTPDREK